MYISYKIKACGYFPWGVLLSLKLINYLLLLTLRKKTVMGLLRQGRAHRNRLLVWFRADQTTDSIRTPVYKRFPSHTITLIIEYTVWRRACLFIGLFV